MRKKWIKRVGFTLLGLIAVLLSAFYWLVDAYINPRSNTEIKEFFKNSSLEVHIDEPVIKEHQLRIIRTFQDRSSDKPLVLFVHGSPGSAMDFKRYLADPDLNELADLMALDRVGYGSGETGKVLASLDEEVQLLNAFNNQIDVSNTIIVGYSYGGTLVMAAPDHFRKKFVLAGAVRSELEPQFKALALTRWSITRPFVPNVFLGAAEEKSRHLTELDAFEKRWDKSQADVVAIHGTADWIVPYENSLFLQSLFSPEKFALISIKEGDHSLIWTNFELIKSELIKELKEH